MRFAKRRRGAVALVLLVALAALSLSTWAEEAPYTGAVFTWAAAGDGVAVTGFDDGYLASLTEAQRGDIAIVIPETIGGKPVTAIGDLAFYNNTHPSYKDCRFTSLDLSQATHLVQIGEMAFDSHSELTGPLALPASLETIGKQAFMGCRFTGSLDLPAALTTLGQGAFKYNTGLTGVRFPAGLTTIENAAFSGCTGLSGELALPKSLKKIGAQAFQSCSALTGTLTLPEGLTFLGSQAFYGTNISTAVLPTDPTVVLENGGTAFRNCARLTALLCTEENYAAYAKSLTYADAKKLLGYPVNVSYADGSAPALERLFGRPLNLVKGTDGHWATDSGFALPANDGSTGYLTRWSFAEGGSAVSPASAVSGATLYPVRGYADPVLTPSDSRVSKVYDGQPVELKIDISHPLKGDKVFFYCMWTKVHNYQKDKDRWSTDNCWTAVDVADSAPGGGDWYQVTVYGYDYATKTNFYKSQTHYFYLDIQPADATVLPVCAGDAPLESGLPSLALGEGSTPGTIAWEEGQTPVAGTANYRWTFEPDSGNYRGTGGEVALTLHPAPAIAVEAGVGGAVSREGEGLWGEDAVYRLTPDPGYRVDTVLADGVPVAATGRYTFPQISGPHTLQVTFAPLRAEEAEEMIGTLPPLDGDLAPEEQAAAEEAVLAAKVHTEALKKGGTELSAGAQDALNAALAQLSTVAVEGPDHPALTLNRPAALLSNMSQEEAAALQAGEISHYRLSLQRGSAAPDGREQAAIETAAQGYVLTDQHSLTLQKIITRGEDTEVVPVERLAAPISLTFTLPPALQAPDGIARTHAVLRTHQAPDGSWSAEILEDVDDSAATVTVLTDRFSTYTLVYRDEAVAPKRCTVHFAGTGLADTEAAVGSLLPQPADPTREGYRFGGWYQDEGCTLPWDFAADRVEGELTLYPRWIPLEGTPDGEVRPAPSPAPTPDEGLPAETGDAGLPLAAGALALLAAGAVALSRARKRR
ncbi:leucine-rich repeat protein [bacterium 210820-DFI.6.52]|nr:leucine-rich repeat protein [bacterium 210820-DFI.6.52]